MTPTETIPADHWTMHAEIVAPSRRSDVIEEDLDAEAVLYDPRTGNTHRLNRTALEIWRRCDGRTTIQQLAQEQTELYEVDPETALDHVEQVLVLLAQAELFEPRMDS
jgi:PqqD family protein of HPr-rel-A system